MFRIVRIWCSYIHTYIGLPIMLRQTSYNASLLHHLLSSPNCSFRTYFFHFKHTYATFHTVSSVLQTLNLIILFLIFSSTAFNQEFHDLPLPLVHTRFFLNLQDHLMNSDFGHMVILSNEWILSNELYLT